MESGVRTKQLCIVSLLSAAGAALRTSLARVAYLVPYVSLPFGFSIYGIFIKIGLTETLAFISGFTFGPAQGFATGALIIVVSDIFSAYGPGLWTPFIAIIIGLIGIIGGELRRLERNPSMKFLLVSAVALTMISELLQNLWFAWYMWAFYMPAVPFPTVIVVTLLGGLASIAAALVNNAVLFTSVSPRIIKLLKEQVELERV